MIEVNNFTFVFATINLVVLFFILKKLLFKPVMNFMDKRKATIQDGLTQAENKMTEANNLIDEYNSKIESYENEASELIANAKKQASVEAQKIIVAAENKAKDILDDSKNTVDMHVSKAMKNLNNKIASIAIAVAGKIIGVKVDSKKDREMVDGFIEKIVEEEGVA